MAQYTLDAVIVYTLHYAVVREIRMNICHIMINTVNLKCPSVITESPMDGAG
jgi:hypothetical protein